MPDTCFCLPAHKTLPLPVLQKLSALPPRPIPSHKQGICNAPHAERLMSDREAEGKKLEKNTLEGGPGVCALLNSQTWVNKAIGGFLYTLAVSARGQSLQEGYAARLRNGCASVEGCGRSAAMASTGDLEAWKSLGGTVKEQKTVRRAIRRDAAI